MSLATTGRSIARTLLDPTRPVRHRPRPLAVAWLPVAVVVFTFLVPGNFVVPGPLRSNGSPGRLFSLVCLGLAVLTVVAAARRRSDTGTPRWSVVGGALVLYLAAATWSYGVAHTSPLDAAESAGAQRSLVAVLGLSGVALYVWLLFRERRDVDRLLGWVVAAAAFSVVVALLTQAGVLPSWAALARSTGLVENTSTLRSLNRLEFTRARGTGQHPLEFSLAITAALPLALHYARFAATRAARARSTVAVVLLLVGVPLAVSRTAILGFAIAAVVAVSIWPAAQKFGAVIAAALAVTAFFVLAPDLIRSLGAIFTTAQDDNSVTGRLDDYTVVGRMFQENPLVGLGSGVYRPETGGVFLDNTWLGTIVGAGALGAAVLALLFLTAGGVAWDRSLLAPDPAARSLDRALLAVLGVVLMGSLTSDLMSFQQPTVVFMVVLGVLASRAGSSRPDHPSDPPLDLGEARAQR
ncbi:hypothetical protein FHR75_002821 [Kineococcus radiotolerans]|uniref:O-antigen ligase-related domain-containing protein n=1 Tax=Kineococcus radiotolerans TaxID=131568 RepID=A0A7W4TPD6_KINRA|nr:O-antigen ligase family protein [Kineococcus radiotolerans]MBB2902006.1 hypothetical protein [Kineococcus radiotolerans]